MHSFNTVGSQAAQRHSHMFFAQQNHVPDSDCTISEKTMCNNEGPGSRSSGKGGMTPRLKQTNSWSMSSPPRYSRRRAHSLPLTPTANPVIRCYGSRYKDDAHHDPANTAACVSLARPDHPGQDVPNSGRASFTSLRTARSPTFSGSWSELGDPLFRWSLPRALPWPLCASESKGTSSSSVADSSDVALSQSRGIAIKTPKSIPSTPLRDMKSGLLDCELNLAKFRQNTPMKRPTPMLPRGTISRLTESREVQLVDASPFLVRTHSNNGASSPPSMELETKQHQERLAQDSIKPQSTSFVRLNAFLLRSHITSVVSALAEDAWIDASERDAFCRRFSSWPNAFLNAYTRFIQTTDVGGFVSELRASAHKDGEMSRR